VPCRPPPSPVEPKKSDGRGEWSNLSGRSRSTGARTRLVERLKARTKDVKRWGGYVLLLIGSWLILLAIFADFFATLFPV